MAQSQILKVVQKIILTKDFCFKSHHIKRLLKQIPDQTVVIPIDKANGNVAFIFKWLSFVVLLKELGISRNIKAKFT